MMYGFGDCSKPLLESAQLVEEIVHQQMNSMLIQSAEIATTRGARFIGCEDLLFMMRKDKIKLKRILKYLEIKDSRNVLLKNMCSEDEDPLESPGVGDIKSSLIPRHKRVKLCMDFLNSIDETGDLTNIMDDDIVDDTKLARDFRRDRQTSCMDAAQYLEYAEARQASFCRKYRASKFRDWLLKDSLTDIKPNSLAMELFNYLAYETVAQIVDLALLVKQDAEPDPFKRIQPPLVCSTECLNFQVFPTTSRSSTSVSESPTQSSSPPSSPASHASGSVPPTLNMQQSTTPPKAKPKKAKKVNTKSGSEIRMGDGITPDNIREAIRRYWKESGPLHLFSKAHRSNMSTRLLCC